MATAKAKILLVDDDQDILDLYGEILRDAGYEVEFAKDGQEGLTMSEQNKYDLILLDLMMPVMDGIEALKRLRGDEAKYGRPVIVALTNVTMAVNVREAFEYGADGYLVKLSVSNDVLVDKVAGYLKGFRQEAPGSVQAPPPQATPTNVPVTTQAPVESLGESPAGTQQSTPATETPPVPSTTTVSPASASTQSATPTTHDPQDTSIAPQNDLPGDAPEDKVA